ncbi:MAG: type II secretion system major pseudopilin GspG [Synergistaceae bacterium]|nr:type II secretion system major pseudopilin GspG [Synergistaceae bacterium]
MRRRDSGVALARRRGFTLIEIMVVVVILGLLAALVVPRIGPQVTEAQRTTARTQIRSIEDALEMYRLHNGNYPTTQQGLDALVTAPTTAPVPKRYADGGYMKKIPDDPWGGPYIYRNRDGRIHIISAGPDGEEGTDDDVTADD